MNYVLYGEEQYLLQESLTRIVKEHVPDANELNKIVYDANITDMETILEDATTIPFFSACISSFLKASETFITVSFL